MAFRSALVATLLLSSASSALAEQPSYPMVSEGGGAGAPAFMRQALPAATSTTSTGLAASRTIYLNHIGATLTPGQNNSQTNTSSIVSRTSQVPGWAASSTDWTATVTCMKEIWAPFDVTITDVDPGKVPHIEAIFARAPSDVGITDYIGGISPFTTDCSVIENSIVFAFTDNLAKKPRVICEVMSQEIAHSYGLDHELLASDPMTYLSYSGNRQFQDQTASCGESQARPCGISGSTCRANQNSVQLLRARVGAANRDNNPPSVAITEPADSAKVEAGFAISATATDNVSVASVAFYVDGEMAAMKTSGPYTLDTDPALSAGKHTIRVEAADSDGNIATEERTVTVAGDTGSGLPSASEALGCSTSRPSSSWLALGAALLIVRRRRRK